MKMGSIKYYLFWHDTQCKLKPIVHNETYFLMIIEEIISLILLWNDTQEFGFSGIFFSLLDKIHLYWPKNHQLNWLTF